ncbi:XdhC family protein [Meiothermus taiwanensis]|uniref:XdhC family protein n=1 Tax=Meiothermus taiwanensis TaxID=172827 RepID=UPI000A53D908|nr:XdhC family protein [Meiothermus taiwanensis]
MDIYSRIAELKQSGQSFALATVVSRQAPVSSHLGDKAIIFEDGRFEGYVGGACSREIVRKQALEVLRLGKPRLVRITPEAAAKTVLEHADEVVIPMTCASEGAVDVYIEPLVGKARLLVVGGSQIALTTAQIAARMNYTVTLACDKPELAGVSLESEIQVLDWRELGSWLDAQNPAKTHIVVASQGHYDEDALMLIAQHMPRPAYLGLVASRKRGATVLDNLEMLGVPKTTFPQLKYPAGLDLGGARARRGGHLDPGRDHLAQAPKGRPGSSRRGPPKPLAGDRAGSSHRSRYAGGFSAHRHPQWYGHRPHQRRDDRNRQSRQRRVPGPDLLL